MSLVALTSLSPSPDAGERQRFCLKSWRRAGLQVVSLNHPLESEAVSGYGAHVLQVENTGFAQYGRHVVPLNQFINLIASVNEPALIINADNELRVTAEQVAHLSELAQVGVPMFAKVHHDADGGNACVEPAGFDAFLLSPRHAHLYAESFLSLGQPWWDYWLPWMIRESGDPLFLPHEPVAFHLRHPGGWDWRTWNMGAVELARLTGLDAGADVHARSRLSSAVYDAIAKHSTRVHL